MKIFLLILILSYSTFGQIKVMPNSVYKYGFTIEFVTEEYPLSYNYYAVNCSSKRYILIHSAIHKGNKVLDIFGTEYKPLSTKPQLNPIVTKLCPKFYVLY